MKSIVFFNNKGGVGKTSLVYHLAWMYADLGYSVLATDLDPQANLTSMFLDEDRLEELWPDGDHSNTVLGVVQPILRGLGDITEPHVEDIADYIGLLPGDLGLSLFEDKLSDAWPRCHDGDEAAFRIISSFFRMIDDAGRKREASLALIDVGPNLGAINRAAIIAADFVVIPLSPDLFSLQGLKNLGPTLRTWRKEWQSRLEKRPKGLNLPEARMQPVGYVVLQHSVRLDRPVKAYQRWLKRIPGTYRQYVLGTRGAAGEEEKDPNELAQIKHYRSLMPMAMEARKPIFHLLPADGAIGSHMDGVQSCRKDFEELAQEIARRCDIHLS
jgi:cellulose biosynthesis protein BcsQ